MTRNSNPDQRKYFTLMIKVFISPQTAYCTHMKIKSSHEKFNSRQDFISFKLCKKPSLGSLYVCFYCALINVCFLLLKTENGSVLFYGCNIYYNGVLSACFCVAML